MKRNRELLLWALSALVVSLAVFTWAGTHERVLAQAGGAKRRRSKSIRSGRNRCRTTDSGLSPESRSTLRTTSGSCTAAPIQPTR
jgi:hypothetical protein